MHKSGISNINKVFRRELKNENCQLTSKTIYNRFTQEGIFIIYNPNIVKIRGIKDIENLNKKTIKGVVLLVVEKELEKLYSIIHLYRYMRETQGITSQI